MPEKLVPYTYIVRKLDDEGKPAGYVNKSPELIDAVDLADAKMRVVARLAKSGVYDPDDPKVEVDARPFNPQKDRQQQK